MNEGKRAKRRMLGRAILFGLLSALLTGGCAGDPNAAGTSSAQSQESCAYEEHMDISVAYWQIEAALENRAEDEVLKTVEEKFNVTIIPQNITWDDYYNKIILWAEIGELPDLFIGAYRKDERFFQWVKEGILHEIPEDLSAYPNLAQYMDSPERKSCMVDDKTWCIFRQTYSEQAETVKDRTIAYRWDLAQEAGITKEPESWEEFQTMIKAIMEADSEGKGIGGMTAKDYTMLIGPLFTYSIPLGTGGGISFDWVPQDEGYVPGIFAGEELGSDAVSTWHLIRDMYEEGVIEEAVFLATTNQAEEKFLTGKSAAICFDGGIGNSEIYSNIGKYWEEVNGSDFFEDVRFLDLMPSVTGELYYTVWGYAWSESYINAKVSDEKLERILAIYDYLLSEEGTLLSNFGIEGETYSVGEDGRISLLTDEPSLIYPSISMLASLVCWNSGIQDASKYPATVPQEYIRADEERVEKARQCSIPQSNYACTVIACQLENPISIDVNGIFQRIVLGTQPVEEIWQEIIEDYKQQGLLEEIEEVNRLVKEAG